MQRSSRRMLALLLGTLLGLAAGFSLRAWLAARQGARYTEERARIRALVGEHARAPRDPAERPFYLAQPDALRLFAQDHAVEVYDPWCYFHHKPHLDLRVPWPEHERGEWRWVTNGLGLREDRELALPKPGLRVIVTGDSHTDGFCDNADSFPHRAQELLAAGRATPLEVVNAANGGFSFYQYLGTLERLLELGLAPDAFVVAAYAGNDFLEVEVPRAWFAHQDLPPATAGEEAALERMREVNRPATTQFLHALYWFHEHPDAARACLETACELLARVRATCDERGIRFLLLWIPAAIDLPWGEDAPLYERLRDAAGLSADDLRGSDRMADELLLRLRAQGCDTLDARPLLRAEPGPWYWKKDFHLNVRGHALLGRALAAKIESWGGRFAR